MLLERKIAAGYAVALGFLLFIGGYAWWSAARSAETFRLVDHTHQVLYRLESSLTDILNMQTASRGFLLTGKESFLDPFAAGSARIEGNLQKLRELTRDNPAQQDLLAALEDSMRRSLSRMRGRIARQREGRFNAVAETASLEAGNANIAEIRAVISKMEGIERRLLAERSADARLGQRRAVMIFGLGTLLAAGLVVGAGLVVRKDFYQRVKAEAERDRFFSLSLDLLCISSGDGYFKRVSPAVTDILGWTMEEFLARPYLEQIHPDDRAASLREVERQLTGGQRVLQFENRFRHKDGSWRTLSWRSVPQPGGLMYAIARDVTDAKRNEAVLEHERYLLRTLMDNTPEDIYFKDRAGRFLRNNQRHARRLGLADPTQAAGRTDFDFFSEEHARQAYADEQEVMRTGQPMTKEEKETWPDGHVTWALTTKLPLRDEKQEIVGTFGISRDITDRRHAEEKIQELNNRLSTQNRRLNAIFESLPGLCLVLTPDLRIVTATDAYLKATMTRREQIGNRHLFEVFPDNPGNPAADGVRNLRTSLERVLQTTAPDTMAIQKYDVRRPDGNFEERFWSPINSPVLGADGRLEYIIHRVEDVTEFMRRKDAGAADEQGLRTRLERMEAEVFQSAQQIQAANRKLELANNELEAFSYSVSHDLRAPLRHIDGFAGLLRKSSGAALGDQGRRQLDTISNAARQMGRLIDDLLSFSRMSRAQVQPVEIDQNALIAALIQENGLAKTSPPVEWRIAPLPPVRADSAMLRQVWLNLLDNAVKYSGKTPAPCVEIGHQQDPNTREQVFFVRDNGAGFDMRYVDKLFGVFQRLHGPAEFEGTGIGLANVRRIITRHGGRTWAEGRVGAGATFYFSLPREEKAEGGMQNAEAGSTDEK